MARKSTNDDQDSASSSPQEAQQQTQTKKSRLWIYIAGAVVVVALLAIAYFTLSGSSVPTMSGAQIINNVSNSNLNQTQTLFVNDLEKSENVTALHVTYYSSNATEYIKQSSNLTVAISNNQTINSYKMGNYNRTAITGIEAYTNSGNGEVIAKNVSSLYYYNTNTTVTCFNDTTYSSGLVTNASLQCYSGDQGISYLEVAPFTAVNVSWLSQLVFNNTVSYSGSKTIAGRNCDNFIISNATSSNIQSNYTVFDLCIDTQYGIPLYFNQTTVAGGIPISFTFTATAVSTNVSGADFVIPQSYLNTIQQSII